MRRENLLRLLSLRVRGLIVAQLRIFLVLALLLLPTLARADTFTGRIVGINDGDTLSVLVEGPKGKRAVKVRLHGIDCPELKQAFGTREAVHVRSYVR